MPNYRLLNVPMNQGSQRNAALPSVQGHAPIASALFPKSRLTPADLEAIHQMVESAKTVRRIGPADLVSAPARYTGPVMQAQPGHETLEGSQAIKQKELKREVEKQARIAAWHQFQAKALDHLINVGYNLDPKVGIPNMLSGIKQAYEGKPGEPAIPLSEEGKPIVRIPRSPEMDPETAEKLLGKHGTSLMMGMQGLFDGASDWAENRYYDPREFHKGRVDQMREASKHTGKLGSMLEGLDIANGVLDLRQAAGDFGDASAEVEQQILNNQRPNWRNLSRRLTNTGAATLDLIPDLEFSDNIKVKK